MDEIIEKAREYALKEISLYGTPITESFVLANEKGQFLAEKLSADKDVVMLGTMFMDLKIGECIKEGKVSEHVERSSKAARRFLEQFDLEKEKIEKIINCIEAHHSGKYTCKEAEICANADCYKFLHPRGMFSALVLWGGREQNVDNIILKAKEKIEEKHKILSLEICKEELEPHYLNFKKLLESASLDK